MLRGVPARSQGNAPWGPRISGPFSRRRRERIYKGTVLVIEESTETVASVGTALPTVELVHITPNGEDTIERAIHSIKAELENRLIELRNAGKLRYTRLVDPRRWYTRRLE